MNRIPVFDQITEKLKEYYPDRSFCVEFLNGYCVLLPSEDHEVSDKVAQISTDLGISIITRVSPIYSKSVK